MVNIYINNELTTEVQFPVTEVGMFSTVRGVVENPYPDRVTIISFTPEDEDVTVEEIPQILQGHESGEFVLKFSPPVERRTPLRTSFEMKVVIG